jgi:hypothetical protein
MKHFSLRFISEALSAISVLTRACCNPSLAPFGSRLNVKWRNPLEVLQHFFFGFSGLQTHSTTDSPTLKIRNNDHSWCVAHFKVLEPTDELYEALELDPKGAFALCSPCLACSINKAHKYSDGRSRSFRQQ